jgi:hypothetical protein
MTNARLAKPPPRKMKVEGSGNDFCDPPKATFPRYHSALKSSTLEIN